MPEAFSVAATTIHLPNNDNAYSTRALRELRPFAFCDALDDACLESSAARPVSAVIVPSGDCGRC